MSDQNELLCHLCHFPMKDHVSQEVFGKDELTPLVMGGGTFKCIVRAKLAPGGEWRMLTGCVDTK